jgi:broad-specificity NMP kinase
MTIQKGPVIVITGTPGTGKSIHAQLLASESPISLRHINVGEWVKEKGLYEGYDDEWQSYTVDEDKVRLSRFPGHQLSQDETVIGRAGTNCCRGRSYPRLAFL